MRDPVFREAPGNDDAAAGNDKTNDTENTAATKIASTLSYTTNHGGLQVTLQPNELLKVSPGRFVAKKGDATVTTKGTFSLKRAFSTASVFQNTFTASGSSPVTVHLSHSLPGSIQYHSLQPEKPLKMTPNAFVASSKNVDASVHGSFAKLLSTNELFHTKLTTATPADVWFASFGPVVEMSLDATKPLTVDNGHLLAWTEGVESKVGFLSGKANAGFFGGMMNAVTNGEGLVVTLTGEGTVWIQMGNEETLANVLKPHLKRR
jgi:uncharacterized protein (TIGR00266 family)